MPDYEFYTASYLGEKIPQESFARFITRAARQLERYKSMFDVRPRAGLREHGRGTGAAHTVDP